MVAQDMDSDLQWRWYGTWDKLGFGRANPRGIEIGAVARQVMKLEVMPVESLRFVPTGVVNDEESAFGVYCGYLLGELIEAILEDIGVDSVKNHREGSSGSRAHRANDIGTEMVSEITHFGPTAPSAPAPPRTRMALYPALVGKHSSRGDIRLRAAQLN